jgi:flagellar hook-associated protein 1 FlgK
VSIFSTFNIGRTALEAHQTAMQVTGQNIANAGNEEYTRQRAILETTPAQDLTYAQLGTGVRVREVQRVINDALEARIDGAASSLSSTTAKQQMLDQIESIFNELSDTDISSALGKFFDSLDALTTNPNDASTRLELISAAEGLGDSLQYMAGQLNEARASADDSIKIAVNDINELTAQIAQLNNQIVIAENGGVNMGTANDLRDKRGALVRQLSEIIGVRTFETSDGSLSVLAGSDFLVFGNTNFTLSTTQSVDRGVLVSGIKFDQNGAQLNINGGKLDGLIAARDQIAAGFAEDLSTLANQLIYQVNRVHSEGLGITGLSDATSTSRVSGPLAELDEAGLDFDVVNGSFLLHVRNENTGETKSINVGVDLDGIGSDSTLQSVVDEINTELAAAFGGSSPVTASITGTNRLRIASSGAPYTFSFSEDTSGFLAAIGMNTFFTGHDALTIGVNEMLADNPDLIAAAMPEAPGGNANALRLAQLRNSAVLNNGASTLEDYWQGVVGSLGVQAASAGDSVDNQTLLLTSLLNERQRISGVNLDEETINLISHQRAYQAAAKLIAVADSMIETLLNAL